MSDLWTFVYNFVESHPDLVMTTYLWLLPLFFALTIKRHKFLEIGQDTSLLSLSLLGSKAIFLFKKGRLEGASALMFAISSGILLFLYYCAVTLTPEVTSLRYLLGQSVGTKLKASASYVIGFLALGLAGALVA